METIVDWYNEERKNRKLDFVTPTERHRRQDGATLSKRRQVRESTAARALVWISQKLHTDRRGDVKPR
ncbi:hypothetical protein A9Q89_11615 [Gammaproteobacteria bacterium 53_120_T64]|nr:hypothetical protein A9Q89_11615 [Gammaproteobacteria bacterium 53_120_T64]